MQFISKQMEGSWISVVQISGISLLAYESQSFLAFQPLQIKSVIAVEGLKGYIYVEAFKQQHVKQAIEDIGNLRIGRWQQLMVPIREMTDVLRVVKDTTGLKQGSWVRIKRGMYKDDIAQVCVHTRSDLSVTISVCMYSST